MGNETPSGRILPGEQVKSGRHRATVVAFVPGDRPASDHAPEAFAAGAKKQAWNDVSYADRYVILVERTSGRGRKLDPHYMAPYAGPLELDNPNARRG